MATNLAVPGVNFGELNACIVRAARLGSDCHPSGGANSGIVTAGLATMTADADMEAGQVFEPKNACGSILYIVRQEDRLKRYNLSGEFIFHDYEMMELIFGGSVILGAAGGSFAGKVMGYADRPFNAAPRNGIYLEVIRQVASDQGDCPQSTGVISPAAVGHIFGKAVLWPGTATYENDVAKVTFNGYSSGNNWLTNGPWNDYPGTAYIPFAPKVEVQYTQTQYNAILAVVSPGYQPNLPVGS